MMINQSIIFCVTLS